MISMIPEQEKIIFIKKKKKKTRIFIVHLPGADSHPIRVVAEGTFGSFNTFPVAMVKSAIGFSIARVYA